MRYKLLLFLGLFCWSVQMAAYKQTLFVDEFQSEVKVQQRVLNLIRAGVLDGIIHTNRVKVIDALSVVPTPDYKSLEKARHHEATYLLKGKLLNRVATDDGISDRPNHHSRDNSYKESFSLRLELIRTSDGTTIYSQNYEAKGSSSGRDASQYNALRHALVSFPDEMRTFIEAHFKVYGALVGLHNASKSRAKEVYINLGYDDPIREGLRFEVFLPQPITEERSERKIGEIRIDNITGPSSSLCKVMRKGSEEILKAINQHKQLRIISRQARLFDEIRDKR